MTSPTRFTGADPTRVGAAAPSWSAWRWTRACIAAETVGMTAASTAAVLSESLSPAAALAVVVAGGLVEGTALGWWQSGVLQDLYPRLRRRAYAVTTLLVAGLGWAAASAPAAFAGSGDGDDAAPPLLLIMLFAGGLGTLMGAALGAAQALTLRSAVAHPWRWVGASAAAWTPTMAIIFAGATTPDSSWPAPAIIATGALTGICAGGVLGVVSGAFIPSLDGPSTSSRIVLWALQLRPAESLRHSLVGLEVLGRRTGRQLQFPVQYAALTADRLVVVPGNAGRKTWWRNIATTPTAIRVLTRDGAWTRANAWVLTADDEEGATLDTEYDDARRAYEHRWGRILPPDQPVVVVQTCIGRSR